MKIARRKPGRIDEGGVLPMINVVFLLLIFFMLAGRLADPDPFGVAPPETAQQRLREGGTVLVTVSAEGAVAVDGEPRALDTLPAAFAAADPGADVAVKADAAVRAERLLAVLDALRQAGVGRLTLLARSAQ